VSELVGIARFKINEGKLGEFKRLSVGAREIVRTKDTGTLRYAPTSTTTSWSA
jgi:quinol monooxygenase YgiN